MPVHPIALDSNEHRKRLDQLGIAQHRFHRRRILGQRIQRLPADRKSNLLDAERFHKLLKSRLKHGDTENTEKKIAFDLSSPCSPCPRVSLGLRSTLPPPGLESPAGLLPDRQNGAFGSRKPGSFHVLYRQ